MFIISIKTDFSAAHHIQGYKGNCSELHGHNYHVEVSVRAHKVNSIGMCVDFRNLKEIAETAISGLDHKNLNTLPFFKGKNPTAEHIAQFIFKRITDNLKGSFSLDSVKVWETDKYAVTYSE